MLFIGSKDNSILYHSIVHNSHLLTMKSERKKKLIPSMYISNYPLLANARKKAYSHRHRNCFASYFLYQIPICIVTHPPVLMLVLLLCVHRTHTHTYRIRFVVLARIFRLCTKHILIYDSKNQIARSAHEEA